jgi:hypothetical protein
LPLSTSQPLTDRCLSTNAKWKINDIRKWIIGSLMGVDAWKG